ncbi:MAG: carbon storage regulator [Pirellulaceae bacterium]|nr:carbon storage regulator [Pirellulaceae bacterium]
MLVLSRKTRQSVVVGGTDGFQHLLKITVLAISNGKVKLGFDVDAGVPVHREELWQRICADAHEHSPPGISAAPVVGRTISPDR